MDVPYCCLPGRRLRSGSRVQAGRGPLPGRPLWREIEESLARSLLRGLCWEYEQALRKAPAGLDPRIALRPNILLVPMRRFGTADAETWTIRINAEFAAAQRFDAVRDVFLHEVAHLWASLHPEGRIQSDHGPVFRSLCARLGADPTAAKSRESFVAPRGSPREGGDGRLDRLRVKVRKLLSLARSPFPEEARAAAAKASELIARHHLSEIEEGKPRDFTSRFLCEPARRHPRHVLLIANILQRFFFVEAVWIPAWVVSKGCVGNVPEISGRPHDVEMALYVFDFIENTIRRQWDMARGAHGFTGRDYRQFALGVASGFYSQLEEERRRLSERIHAEQRAETRAGLFRGRPCMDLVNIFDPALGAYVRQRYGRLRSIGRPGLSLRASYDAGRKVGREMVLSRGLESSSNDSAVPTLPV